MRKWLSVAIAVGIVAGSIVGWVVAMNTAWDIGSWVGASTPIPRSAVLVAFLPTILDTAIAAICIPAGILRRSGILITAGVTAIVMAGLLFLLTAWSLAMGSIT